ncbi:hypothetical protein [Flavobacterium panici]|uniref:Uncharacterized protein n=1 Tax=Flavobacterium panici TaxID=2654843 RepID=A0A9N8P151_9FLAO|nr:hypothetical protein [Flavobacterium panici]CAC9973771.1 hypothetical protein FLAPXU55_01459 [Flavobacterium panici]
MKDLRKEEDFNPNIDNTSEEDFLSHLKAEIKRGKEDLKNGNFITHEEMLLELKRKKII